MEFSLIDGGEPFLPSAATAMMQQLLEDLPDELERQLNPPRRAYVRDRRAMANTPMDVKELPSSCEIVLAVDMPGVSPADVKVQVEDGNLLTVTGERKRPADEEDGVKYLRMDRRMGMFMRRFPLPESADIDGIRAEYKDGVLTVTVQKKPPPELKKTRLVEVKVAGAGAGEPKGK